MSRPLILLCCAALAGCASNGDFPSLAPRPVEKSDAADAGSASLSSEVDGELARRLAAIVEAGEAGHRSFLDESAAARPVVGKALGAAPGGDAWVSAQAAYSGVVAAHGVLLSALADLDLVRREQLGSVPANYGAATAAATRLEALAREEVAVLAELAAKLG